MSYPRETVEHIAVTVLVDDVPATSGVEIARVSTLATRPTTWVAAVILDGKTGFMIDHEQPGNQYVYARVSDSPETPVVYCGAITID